mgnify:CR=1 FL=1
MKNSTESGSIESGYKIEKNYCTETNDYISYINQGRVIDVVSNHKPDTTMTGILKFLDEWNREIVQMTLK